MPAVRADDIAIFKRKKKIKRKELESPLIERIKELERRVSELEKAVKRKL